MPYFETTLFAAPGLGLLAAAIMAGLGWLGWRVRSLRARGEGWDDGGRDGASASRAAAPRSGSTTRGRTRAGPGDRPSARVALAAVLIVLIGNLVFSTQVMPRLDAAYLAEPRWGGTRLQAVAGLWSILGALTLAILFLLAALGRRLTAPLASLGAGADASALPILNTACLVGFGAVVAGLPAFAQVQGAIEGVGGGPLVSLAISTSVLAGLTGSASGGMRIALDALGADYAAMAAAGQVSAEALHRVAAIATGGLDALPHNGAVVTLLSLCGLSHRQSYPDIFMVAVAGPLLALAAVLVVAAGTGAS
ncbi:MAG: hypothetical protein AAF192_21550 [Pseudomonadota bacterium]